MAPSSGTSRERLPFPQNQPNATHMSPAGREYQRSTAVSTASSVSVSSSSSQPNSSTSSVTVDSLLAAHVTSSDPKLAALEQAVSERNTLSSQNAQLWKLVEKQRSGYNQILKELERVRAERDSYKLKLGVVGGPQPERRHRSHDHSKPTEPRESPESAAKVSSDEKLTPRSTNDPLITQTQATSSRSQTSSLTPLIVPPRSESLPMPASASSSSPDNIPFQHAYSDSISSSATSYSSSSSSRPLTTPRKNSMTDSIRSTHTPPQHSSTQYPSGAGSATLTTAPAFSPALTYTPQQGHQTSHPITSTITPKSQPSQAPQAISFTSITSSPPLPSPNPSTFGTSKTPLLSVLGDNRSQPLSRDSRITLPDEAKQYIVNMAESPMPSPKATATTNGSVQFQDLATPTQPGYAENATSRGEFLDLDDEDGVEDESPDGDEFEVVGTLPETAGNNTNPHATIEEFPLPPSVPSMPQYPVQQTPLRSDDVVSNTSHSTDQLDETDADMHFGRNTFDTALSNRESSHLAPVRRDSSPPSKASYRALPLLSSDLPHTTISVSNSFVRPNDRGKDVLSFVIQVNPGNGKQPWRVEKLFSDVQALDQRVRNSVGKSLAKKMVVLPEGKLWKDHAPAKVDQRKAVLEGYLQALINLPIKNNDEAIAFFTSDIMRDKQPVLQAGHKEGYLTKRGKNFGGWKARYFVLSGPVLEYYDCRGGTHLGSIVVAGAQIGRQQRAHAVNGDDEKEYRHAFLIVEAKKGPGGNHPRHVLCAESDEDRDDWVNMLVRYFSGRYSEESLAVVAGDDSSITLVSSSSQQSLQNHSSRSSNAGDSRRPTRGLSRDDIAKGPAIPMSQLPPDATNTKLFQNTNPAIEDHTRSPSPSKSSMEPSPIDRYPPVASGDSHLAKKLLERTQGQPSSLPDSSPLSNTQPFADNITRANSELGHYPDLQEYASGQHHSPRHLSPERTRTRDHHADRKSLHPSSTSSATTSDRVPSPERMEPNGKVKISGPLNGAPIPAGYKFGGKDSVPTPSVESSSASDRREKAKSRFWSFARPNANGPEKPAPTTYVPRAVFGVTLDEALEVASIANLPAIVFRCIQYLEAKKSDQEEGIYRLSGSSAVIKSLKDRFNAEGDVDLLASDEYWDPHAIAGLLKGYLRELPASILTRDLHLRFLAVMEIDPRERIKELSHLIASLPIANYSLLRALTAHLILIVQNCNINKMTMRNVGIVFSPTLGIPAGVFSLMLGEFNRVFNVDPEDEDLEDEASESGRRNSRQYSDAAADQLLGLSGRKLMMTPAEEPSDVEEVSAGSVNGASENEELDQSRSSSRDEERVHGTPPHTPSSVKTSKASHAAALKGLNVSVTKSERGHRYSRMMGLPTSPRPPPSPAPPSPSAAAPAE